MAHAGSIYDGTVGPGNYVRPYRPIGRIVHLPADLDTAGALNATFIKGDVVVIADGQINVAGANPTAVAGVAAEDAVNATPLANQERNPHGQILRPVWIADDDSEFVMVTAAGVTPTEAYVGTNRDIARDGTNNIWRVGSGTGNARVKVVQVLDPGMEHGRVVVRFLAAARALFEN